MILQVESIDTYYGKSHILQDVSLDVAPGEAVALLGRNGVGKTTTLRSVMGLSPPRDGSIRFKEEEIRGKPPHFMARAGIAYMPDDLRIFPDLTCEENLEIARRLSKRTGYWNKNRVEELFPVLGERRRQMGINLSGGEKKNARPGKGADGQSGHGSAGRTLRGAGPHDCRQPGPGHRRDPRQGDDHLDGRSKFKILPAGLQARVHFGKRLLGAFRHHRRHHGG